MTVPPVAAASSAVEAVLFDLLMAVMDSPAAWSRAVEDDELGLRWRDLVTSRMVAAGHYAPYEDLVVDAARELALPHGAVPGLWAAWERMEPRPDVAAIGSLPVRYAFVTNASRHLAGLAARRSGLAPAFVLSAEEAGWYKPRPEVYRVACERIGTEPERTAFVAGAPYDAEGARAAGLVSILVVRRPLPEPLHPAIRRVGSVEDALSSDVVGLRPRDTEC